MFVSMLLQLFFTHSVSLILEKFNTISVMVYYIIFKIWLTVNVCFHRKNSIQTRNRSPTLTSEVFPDMLPARAGLLDQMSMCKKAVLEMMTRCRL
jgi:hypothetical protein